MFRDSKQALEHERSNRKRAHSKLQEVKSYQTTRDVVGWQAVDIELHGWKFPLFRTQ